jgi:hypothetical protein
LFTDTGGTRRETPLFEGQTKVRSRHESIFGRRASTAQKVVVAMTRRRMVKVLLLLAAGAAGAAQGPQTRVEFRLDATDRHVQGISREVDWSMVALDDGGGFAVRLVVPAESLVSDDAAFDAALRKALDPQTHPYIEVRGIARQGRFDGALYVGDVEKPLSLPVEISHADGFTVATVTAPVQPSKCGLDLPDSTLTVTFRVPASGNAVLAGGVTRL